MKNEIILWISSIIIIFLIGYFKNVTSPDYPVMSTFGIEGKKVSYKLDKVCFDKQSYKNIILSDISGLKGEIILLKDGVQRIISYKEIKGGLECEIPRLKAGEKIKYKVELNYDEKTFEIPKGGYITLTFWGNIPSAVNGLVFIFLFGGLLFSIRCLLEIFNKDKNLKKYAIAACAFFLILNSIIIPLKNSYKLGAINSYVPRIIELIDPYLLLILFLWIVGTIFFFYKKFTNLVLILITLATVILFCFF
jgi:hypothetical protein